MIDIVNKTSEKYGLDLETMNVFAHHLRHINIDKSVHLVEAGGFDDNFYILREGLLRAYLPDEDGDHTLWFGYPGQAIFNIWCYHYGRRSPISIEAVIPSVVCCIPKADLENLCSNSLPVCNLVRKIFIGHAAETEESTTSLFGCEGGLERYLSIQRRHPELLQNVPLKKLASYLHLAPQSLSRIRGKIK